MATVSVGCKLPHGAHLQLFQTVETPAGKINKPISERVTINGANSSNVIGGHGVTHNVDSEFFTKWLEANKESVIVKKGLIFAHEKTASVESQAKEKETNKTGLEGIDPNKPAAGIKPEAYEGMPK